MATKVKLTALQLLFCIAFMRSRNLDYREACRAVGITDANGRKWMMQDAVKAKIDELFKKRAERLLIDADAVVLELMANAKVARNRGLIRESNESLSLLGRHLGMGLDSSGGSGGSIGTQVVFGGNQVALTDGKGTIKAFERHVGPIPLEQSAEVMEEHEETVGAAEQVPRRADMPRGVFSSNES